jgi:hypothetical protein
VDDEGRRAKEIDAARAAAEMAALVGPLVAACRAMVADGPIHRANYCDNIDCIYCGAAIDEGEPHRPDCAYTMAVAALAAIDRE